MERARKAGDQSIHLAPGEEFTVYGTDEKGQNARPLLRVTAEGRIQAAGAIAGFDADPIVPDLPADPAGESKPHKRR